MNKINKLSWKDVPDWYVDTPRIQALVSLYFERVFQHHIDCLLRIGVEHDDLSEKMDTLNGWRDSLKRLDLSEEEETEARLLIDATFEMWGAYQQEFVRLFRKSEGNGSGTLQQWDQDNSCLDRGDLAVHCPYTANGLKDFCSEIGVTPSDFTYEGESEIREIWDMIILRLEEYIQEEGNGAVEVHREADEIWITIWSEDDNEPEEIFAQNGPDAVAHILCALGFDPY